MPITDLDPTWYTLRDVQEEKDSRMLVAMGLNNYGNCMAGFTPPSYFGEVMVELGVRLGITPLPENFHRLADEILKK